MRWHTPPHSLPTCSWHEPEDWITSRGPCAGGGGGANILRNDLHDGGSRVAPAGRLRITMRTWRPQRSRPLCSCSFSRGHILCREHILSRVPRGLGEEDPPVPVHSLENTFYIENTFYLENLEASAKQTPLLLFVCQGPLAEPRQLAVCENFFETSVKRDLISVQRDIIKSQKRQNVSRVTC